MVAKQIFFEGRVQGVGFRYQIKQMAMGYEVIGWVQNLPDGRVELHVAGEPAEIAAFLTEIDDSDLAGLVRKKEEHTVPMTPGLRGFEIRR